MRLGACSRVFRLKNSGYRRDEAEKHFLRVAKEKSAAGKLERHPSSTQSTTTSSLEKDSKPALSIPQGKIRCAHILLKHTGSRTPSSHRGPVIRTLEQAREEMRDILVRVREDPALFKKYATDVSECSSFKHGGDLGFFEYQSMQPSFSAAAFALDVGGISDLVESPSGVHIILRIA